MVTKNHFIVGKAKPTYNIAWSLSFVNPSVAMTGGSNGGAAKTLSFTNPSVSLTIL